MLLLIAISWYTPKWQHPPGSLKLIIDLYLSDHGESRVRSFRSGHRRLGKWMQSPLAALKAHLIGQ
jgi:hypothetical protein